MASVILTSHKKPYILNTISAFCIDIVKQNVYIINIDKESLLKHRP